MTNQPLDKYKPTEQLKLKDLSKKKVPFTKVNCPACDTPTPADNLNIQDKVAKCSNCDAIFPFQAMLDIFTNTAATPPAIIMRPEGIDLFRFEKDLEINIRQTFADFDFVLLFIPFLAIFATLLYFSAKTDFSIWWTMPFWLGSLYALYSLVTYKDHKEVINIGERYLSIIRRPKKFRKDLVFNISEVNQIYVKNIESSHEYFSLYGLINSEKGQKHVCLVKYLKGRSSAKYLEQTIENHLKIVDQRIPEEVVFKNNVQGM